MVAQAVQNKEKENKQASTDRSRQQATRKAALNLEPVEQKSE